MEPAMTKIVSASEFKATCLKLIDAMQKDGQPVTITKRGRVVAKLTPEGEALPVKRKPVFGMLKSDVYRYDDPTAPVSDMDDWDVGNPVDLYRRHA
jgi:prevent-host-death family protein